MAVKAECCCQSGGGGSSLDRFAPRYLVGNTTAPWSDSLIAQGAPFQYFPDPGDCSGIAAALAAAALVPGDVWIRQGVYDMNLPGCPPGPLVIPDSCRVSGVGPINSPFGPPLGIIGRATGDQGIFTMGAISGLRDIALLSFGPAGGPGFGGQTSLVQINGPADIDHVVALMLSDDPAIVCRTIFDVLTDSPVQFTSLYMQGQGFNDPDPALWMKGIRIPDSPDAFVSLQDMVIAGLDCSLEQDQQNVSVNLHNVLMLYPNRRGIYQTARGFVSMTGSSLLLAGTVDCIGAELQTGPVLGFAPLISQSRFVGVDGQNMNVPAILVHGPLGSPPDGGRVRIQGNALIWPRSGQGPIGNSVIELGASGSGERVSLSSVEGNVIYNPPGGGVEVAGAACRKNIIGGGSMEVAFGPAATDFGTLTNFYPISVEP